MAAADEVALPGGEGTVRFRAVLDAQHVADEHRQRLGVVIGGASQHEAVAQIPDHRSLLRAEWRTEHSRAAEN